MEAVRLAVVDASKAWDLEAASAACVGIGLAQHCELAVRATTVLTLALLSKAPEADACDLVSEMAGVQPCDCGHDLSDRKG